ncbi:response regulator transcription factor [Paenibacillus alba]|uniref:LuxR C-terminal-related transcriptional regulator n=1 Tax=Paenibacillus alba TaxID=1197127 RepID=A0ABU6G4E3_9BACL|nr:LuxR C-terminal-related transcriptional regulator [Paenibacillus alba]MEC0229038.1 LuxR C-terminal-related transcriptional regulator [Paenibacillus alba]
MRITTLKITNAIAEMSNLFNLTPRESEIFELLSMNGYNNKELSIKLFISEKTIKNHIANIMLKSKCNSTRQLLSMVINYQGSAFHFQYTKKT